MHRDDQRIMSRRDLDRAARQQPAGIALAMTSSPARCSVTRARMSSAEGHAACRNVTQLAVKPGPSAVSSERDGRPACAARSSTNSTVGADMLP